MILFQVPPSAYPALDGLGSPSSVNPNGLVLAGTEISERLHADLPNSVR